MRDLKREGFAPSEKGSSAIVIIFVLAIILFITSQQSHTGTYGLGSRYYRTNHSTSRYHYADDYDKKRGFRYFEDRNTYSYNRYSIDDLYYRNKFEYDSFGDYDEDYFYNPQEN